MDPFCHWSCLKGCNSGSSACISSYVNLSIYLCNSPFVLLQILYYMQFQTLVPWSVDNTMWEGNKYTQNLHILPWHTQQCVPWFADHQVFPAGPGKTICSQYPSHVTFSSAEVPLQLRNTQTRLVVSGAVATKHRYPCILVYKQPPSSALHIYVSKKC